MQDGFPAFLGEIASKNEAEASYQLGRLQGALAFCSPAIRKVFAARVVRHTLVSALRQEGHEFTDDRFHAWFAGLVTLCDIPPRAGRPARVLCEAILTELRHSPVEELAMVSTLLLKALLAPDDHTHGDAASEANTVIAEARALIRQLPDDRSPLPFVRLAHLHSAIAGSLHFAPVEHSGWRPGNVGGSLLPSPRWALELVAAPVVWTPDAAHSPAVPLPGLVRLDALGDSPEAADRRATALTQAAGERCADLDDCAALWSRIEHRAPGRRSTSRAPGLYAMLAGYGALRSRQIEAMLGATRIGVRGMLANLDEMGLIARMTIAGSHLNAVSGQRPPPLPAAATAASFSAEALNDYEASLAAIDRLLERGSSTD